jgi:hypothetical protein
MIVKFSLKLPLAPLDIKRGIDARSRVFCNVYRYHDTCSKTDWMTLLVFFFLIEALWRCRNLSEISIRFDLLSLEGNFRKNSIISCSTTPFFSLSSPESSDEFKVLDDVPNEEECITFRGSNEVLNDSSISLSQFWYAAKGMLVLSPIFSFVVSKPCFFTSPFQLNGFETILPLCV